MTVSKIASKIYKAAKAAEGVWDWRLEWSKAMKQAWRKVMTTTNQMDGNQKKHKPPTARHNVGRNYNKENEMKGYEENREQRRTHAKYVYCKLCRNGELEAAQRVLRLLTNGSLPFFNGDADWTASLELTREKCIPSRVNARGTSETFWI